MLPVMLVFLGKLSNLGQNFLDKPDYTTQKVLWYNIFIRY